VGIGDSTTLRQMRIPQVLKERGTKALDPFELKDSKITSQDAMQYTQRTIEETAHSDVFLTRTNAITRDGKLVNVDGAGNRVAGMFWGHPISLVTVGRNKIVRDLDEAFYRIRNVIAPNHIRIKSVELGGRQLIPI
jgi:hypothetical protein